MIRNNYSAKKIKGTQKLLLLADYFIKRKRDTTNVRFQDSFKLMFHGDSVKKMLTKARPLGYCRCFGRIVFIFWNSRNF